MSQPPSSAPQAPATGSTPTSTSGRAAGTATSFDVVDDLPGEFAERVVEAFHYRRDEHFSLVLCGGSTAAWCYERLAWHGETQIDWWRVDLFWADEQIGAPDEGAPHERLVREVLLDRVGAANALYPLRGPVQVAAAEAALVDRRLDVVHLDLGVDGTLSATTGERGAILPGRRIASLPGEAGRPGRYAFTPLALATADLVLITAATTGVRNALAAVRRGDDVPGNRLGASRVAWLVDRDAGR